MRIPAFLSLLVSAAALPAAPRAPEPGIDPAALALLLEESALTAEAETVMTAARYQQRVDRTPSNVHVLTREKIDAIAPKSIPDLLRYVPGFAVFRRQELGHELSAFGVGGQFSNKILVLLDGHRVTQPGFGSVPWVDLPVVLEELERVEVVLGPESTLYGSNAFAAVVNFITGRPRDKDREVTRVAAGNRGYSDLSYHRAVPTPGGDLRVSLRQELRGGFGPLVDGGGAPDAAFVRGEGSRRRVARVVHESRRAGGGRARVSLALTEADVDHLALAPGAQAETDGVNRGTWASLDLSRELGGDSSLHAKASFSRIRRRLSRPPFATVGVLEDQVNESLGDFELRLQDIAGPWKVSAGLYLRHATVISYTSALPLADDDATTTEFFAQGERTLGERWVLFLGTRYTQQDISDDAVSWKASTLYRPRPDTGLRLSVGTSFRQPDLLSARFATRSTYQGAPVNPPVFRANADLRNEVAREFVQFGFEKSWRDTRAKVDFYSARLENLLRFAPVGPPLVAFTPAPTPLPIRGQRWESLADPARVRGMTLSTETRVGPFDLALAGNFLDVDNYPGAGDAPYAPSRSGSLLLSLPPEGRRWWGSLGLTAVGSVDVDINARLDGAAPTLPGYGSVDLMVGRRLSPVATLRAGVRNLLDKRHREMIYSLIGDTREQGVSFGREAWLEYRVEF